MDRTYIIDASPLILFGKVDQLRLVASLGSNLVVPSAVIDEIAAGPGGQQLVQELNDLGRFRIESAIVVPNSIAQWDLGAGESQVLALAVHISTSEVVIDDLTARKCARTLGCPMVGTLGLVALMKQRGNILAAKPLLLMLVESGLRIARLLVDNLLAQLHED